ncbi:MULTISPECIES: heme exporter protein CcmD [Labrys]|uniref:Heme exporter protein D n=1 Tax=Labrys neptuniae TaxID=376174 RepID=A0ABV3PWV3_9HYPH
MVLFGMDLGPHWAFIVWAYGLAVAVIVLLIAWVVLDHKAQHRTLADLEAQGLRRRSRRDAKPDGQLP